MLRRRPHHGSSGTFSRDHQEGEILSLQSAVYRNLPQFQELALILSAFICVVRDKFFKDLLLSSFNLPPVDQ